MELLDRGFFGLLGFVAVGIVLPALPACSYDKSGIMLAISTDMLAPKDVNAVGVTVFMDDKIKFNVVGRVTPEGEVLLPATLAIAEPDDPNATVRIRVIAFQEKKARVMRDVRTSIPKGGRIALLRIPLNFANDGSVTGELPDNVLPVPATTKSLDSSALFPRDLGTTDLYDPTLFVPNCPDPTQTWIAGQCADAFVPWASLPTFTSDAVGRADDTATCFDVYGCFAGSTDIPETGTTGVTLDRPSCSLVLNGANPAQLNVALVTAQTGACIASGSCYVPLDHGAAGWTESAGTVQLPAYVCKLTPTTASLVLAPSSTAPRCGAKTESRAACATTSTTNDAGTTDAGASALVSAEDFAASITIETGSSFLDTAGAGRVARIDVRTGVAAALAVPAGKKPWKFGSSPAGALLTDGSGTGYAIAAGGAATAVTLTTNGHDVAEVSAGRMWAVGTSTSTRFDYSSATDAAASIFPGTRVINPNAIVAMSNGTFVAGTTGGTATVCTLVNGPSINCFVNDTTLNPAAIVDGLAADPTSKGLGTWALTQNGLYYLTSDGTTLASQLILAGTTAGPVDGAIYLRRAVAAAGGCAVLTSDVGVQWMAHETGTTQHGGVLFIHQPGAPDVLGVAADATSVYYSVYAAASDGGGLFRADLPAECATH